MPINDAITAAKALENLRDQLADHQTELARVNAYRTTLQQKIAEVQAAFVAKRAELRAATADL